MNEKIGFVLAGGSIKGSYQIGQIEALIDNGIYPDFISGISVGSINAAMYANFLYETNNNHKHTIRILKRIWKSIDSPSKIVKKRNIFSIARDLLFNNFKSFIKTDPLEKLLKRTLDPYNINKSNIEISVGTVDINDGKIYYYKNDNNSNILDYVIASTRIPLIMPLSNIKNKKFYDGGLVDNAGINEAIKAGCTKIYVLTTHTEHINKKLIQDGNISLLIDRIMEIIVINTLNNDIKLTELYNSLTKSHMKRLKKKKVDLNVFRPTEMLDIDILKFDKYDIERMINKGYVDVTKTLSKD